jgi:hypothetical protein
VAEGKPASSARSVRITKGAEDLFLLAGGKTTKGVFYPQMVHSFVFAGGAIGADC